MPKKEPYSKEVLMKYRLDASKSTLHEAQSLLKDQSYRGTINRSYYAMFTGVRALLAMIGRDYSAHYKVIGEFDRSFVKPRLFEVKYSKYLHSAFQTRCDADYQDLYIAKKEVAEMQCAHAEEMCSAIEKFIMQELDTSNKHKNKIGLSSSVDTGLE